MIDVSEYIKQLEDLKVSFSHKIDECASSHKYHMRIVFDKPIPFPKNYEMVGNDSLIECSHLKWNQTEGWGQPDKEFLGVELRYLWRQFNPFKKDS